MNQRVQRLSTEIREILGEILSRQEIKDPRVQDAGIITLTHVRLTGDLQQATALFTVHGADAAKLKRVRDGLNHAASYLRRRFGRELSVRIIPTIRFEVDKIFEQEERVDALLREVGRDQSGQASAGTGVETGSATHEEDPSTPGSAALEPDKPAED
jgi:ribosome-binding factor A